MSKNNLYFQLVDFVNKKISASDIDDELIKKVKNNGIITLDFDSDKFIEILSEHESDSASADYIQIAIGGNYGYHYGYFMFDDYRARDDWQYGYVLMSADATNEEKLKEISGMLGIDWGEDVEMSKLSQTIHELYEGIAEDIINEYQSMSDDAMKECLREYAYDELCGSLDKYGIFHSGDKNLCFRKYATTAKNLIQLYESMGEKYYDVDLENLLKGVAKENEILDIDVYDYTWNTYWNFFDNKQWNEFISEKLDDLLSEIEEKLDELEDYKKIKQRLKDYKFGVWYDIPKNDRRMFKIDQVNPESLKIMFSYKEKGSGNKIEKVSMNIDNFMLFLHHPELF
jgi:hypothetical protein